MRGSEREPQSVIQRCAKRFRTPNLIIGVTVTSALLYACSNSSESDEIIKKCRDSFSYSLPTPAPTSTETAKTFTPDNGKPIPNHVGVHFRPGEIETTLSALNKCIEDGTRNRNAEEVKRFRRVHDAIVLDSLGLDGEWSVASFYDPPEGYTVTVASSRPFDLDGKITELGKKPDVLKTFKDYERDVPN